MFTAAVVALVLPTLPPVLDLGDDELHAATRAVSVTAVRPTPHFLPILRTDCLISTYLLLYMLIYVDRYF
jgi:hypothetical protein